jgi:heptosyltransferase-2
VVIYDKKGDDAGIKGFIRFANRLRRERFDAAILFQKAIEAAIMAFLSGIPLRIGFTTDRRGFLLSHGVKFSESIKKQHHTKHFISLLEQVGILGGDGRQLLRVTDSEKAWSRQTLNGSKWAVINPGAAYGSAKRWLPHRFAQVADRLADRYDCRILLIGGPGEMDIGREIEEKCQTKVINYIGKTTVREMMALISICKLMVTNDSGPMHVGAALGVPIVAIFGSTDHTTTFPAGVAHKIVRKDFPCAPCLLRQCPIDHRCMNAVEAEDVLSAVDRLIQDENLDFGRQN